MRYVGLLTSVSHRRLFPIEAGTPDDGTKDDANNKHGHPSRGEEALPGARAEKVRHSSKMDQACRASGPHGWRGPQEPSENQDVRRQAPGTLRRPDSSSPGRGQTDHADQDDRRSSSSQPDSLGQSGKDRASVPAADLRTG